MGGPGRALLKRKPQHPVAIHKCLHLLRSSPHALPQELERLTASVPAVLRPLLQPYLDDLADKMQPGLLVLTWTSMNIDGYLHRFHQASEQGVLVGYWRGAAPAVRSKGWSLQAGSRALC